MGSDGMKRRDDLSFLLDTDFRNQSDAAAVIAMLLAELVRAQRRANYIAECAVIGMTPLPEPPDYEVTRRPEGR
jgi:hypothetical protein